MFISIHSFIAVQCHGLLYIFYIHLFCSHKPIINLIARVRKYSAFIPKLINHKFIDFPYAKVGAGALKESEMTYMCSPQVCLFRVARMCCRKLNILTCLDSK